MSDWQNVLCHAPVNIKRSNSYMHTCTMVCPLVHGDNPRALAGGLYPVPVDHHVTLFIPPRCQCRRDN